MFPLIAKPLIVAGTKQSHYTTALSHHKALETFFLQPKKSTQSHLLQEHVNHDTRLSKAHMLGDIVSGCRRNSLPNLPPPPLDAFDGAECVEFDSQRPCPKLSNFGVVHDDDDDKNSKF
jgi:hypothetical protein